jgi:hypothetical protein
MSPNAVIGTLPDEAQEDSTAVSAEEPAAGEALRKRAWSRLGDPATGLRVFGVRVLNYRTNHVGGRAIILPGVTVGRGAVVTKYVPPLTIVAGVPAKPIDVRDAATAVYELDKPLPVFK